jgi:flagellar protein FlgJ
MQNMGHVNSQLEMSRNVHDFGGLDTLRQAAKSGDKEALDEAAKQFEAIFVQMMLKSMRKAQDALADKDSPFNSQQVKFYRDMHDQQLATDLSASGSIGLADIIVKQLSQADKNYTPASLLRGGADLDSARLSPVDSQLFDAQRLRSEKASSEASRYQSSSKQSAFSDQESFVKELLPIITPFAEKLNLSPRALLAQAALETGWGQHIIHKGQQNSHNLFGIKASRNWQGDKALVPSLEYENGVAKPYVSAFKAYGSFEESMQDYVNLVTNNPRYQSAVSNADDPARYFSELQKSGYATDPEYANKVLSVLKSEVMQGAE